MGKEENAFAGLNDANACAGSTEAVTKSDKHNYRWNFWMGMVHAVFFNGATSFVHPDTVIPLFLSTLTSSSIIIGIASMIRGTIGGLGSVIPQLLVAAHLQCYQRRKPFLVKTLVVRAASFFFLGLITLILYNRNPPLLIIFFLVLSFVFTVTGGVASVPFYDIWSRSLPHSTLGSFFAHRHLWGGLFAIVTGLAVTKLLGCGGVQNQEKYALMFFCSAVLMSIGFVGLGFLRENPAEKQTCFSGKTDVLFLAAKITLHDKTLRYYICAFLLTGAPAMALPFLVLYAKEYLKFSIVDIGLFLVVQMVGKLSVTLIWGLITDKYGCRLTAIVSSIVAVAFLFATILPLILPFFPRSIMYCVYALIGAWAPGRQIGFDKMLLRMSSEKVRPIYIALKGTLSLPLVLYPVTGALLMRWSCSYSVLLWVTMVLTGFGLLVSFILPNRTQVNVSRSYPV